jgi:UDP-3-O-[3-hydroxymyristoyl] glucosamine N-acyltransferase
MADPRFFQRTASQSIADLCAGLPVTFPDSAANRLIDDVAPLDRAGSGDLSFFENSQYLDQMQSTQAAACLLLPVHEEKLPPSVIPLITDNPYWVYAQIAARLYPPADALQGGDAASFQPIGGNLIHPTAIIDPNAKLGQQSVVGAYTVIKAGVELGHRVQLGTHVVLGQGVVIGDDTLIDDHVVISHTLIGQKVRIYRGAKLGQPGFGYAFYQGRFTPVPQLGRVVVEDGVEIGANTTIDRGSGPDTIIGSGSIIDNLVQIGHNVVIGKGCVLVSQVGIAGSTKLGDYVQLGGQAGLTGHLKIGSGAKIGAQSGVMRDIEAGMVVAGSPAVEIRQFGRQAIALTKLVAENRNVGKKLVNEGSKKHDDSTSNIND